MNDTEYLHTVTLVRETAERKTEPLSDEEALLAAALLCRAGKTPNLERPIIEAFWRARVAPLNPVECVIVDSLDAPTKMLVAERADSRTQTRSFHFPGKFFPSGATIEKAVRFTCEEETGLRPRRFEIAGLCNFPKLERNHELSVVAVCELENPAACKTACRWFPFDQPPENLLPHHRAIHARAKAWLSLPPSLRKTCVLSESSDTQ